MIYGNETISHYSKSNISVWMIMAFQAGVLNVGGFLACHRFVSHVTGFATFFAIELSKNELGHSIGMLVVPFFYLLGAMLSGLLVDIQIRNLNIPKYFISFGIIFIILLNVIYFGSQGWFGQFGIPMNDFHDYLLLLCLCFVCGLQNGTITTVSKSVIRTTHLTGLTTDLGIGLTRILMLKKDDDIISNEKKATLMRLGIILFFGLGSIAGAFTFLKYHYLGFSIPAFTSGALFILMIFFQFKKSKLKKNYKKS